MFSKVNGNVDLYPKQTIAKESPTNTRSTLASSTMDPDMESHAVSAMILFDFSLYLTRSEGNIRIYVTFFSKNAIIPLTRPFAVLTPKPGQDRKVAATRDA